jgi:hypothetical protein
MSGILSPGFAPYAWHPQQRHAINIHLINAARILMRPLERRVIASLRRIKHDNMREIANHLLPALRNTRVLRWKIRQPPHCSSIGTTFSSHMNFPQELPK